MLEEENFHHVKFIFLSNWNYVEGLQFGDDHNNDHKEKEKKLGREYEEIWWRRRRNE